ncbi:hypothetical protein PYW07_005400 [Mythimna separata]|uniref:Uncharacterized protein n=1 Tax=Mythimna separata TaxID=271217 RepID=A0AAD7YET3_MYTSE|nr:hypothetical protein PYW07_005400 [Mythimna separata]
MALDKQKILNELGSVVNQLQSADCGCMGKLFSNSNQPNQNGGFPANDGCMRGCCHGHSCGHHGYNAPGAGEPFSGNQNCMGYCNPPKLFADTYNYLNNNLMQPAVKEVYNDLKSISPANTMMNNPMGAQMGLSPANPVAQGGMGGQMGMLPGNPTAHGAMGGQMGNMAQNQMPGGTMGNQNAMSHHNHGPNVRFANSNMGNSNMQMSNPNNQQQMGQPTPMSGMGPNIVNMMMGDAAAQRASNPNQGGPQGGNNATLGQHSGGMPSNNPGRPANMGMNNMGQGNPGTPMQHPNPQYTHPNMYTNMQGNTINGNMGQMNPGTPQMQGMNPAQQQMKAQNPGYGQHNAGMAKFNEMFPGVMQGGDLGFDPMAIAIQMNPANQQKAAMDTMQKMMMSNGKGVDANSPLLQPVINATNAAMANIAQTPTNQAPGQHNMVPTSMQQPIPVNAGAAPVQNNQVPPQQAYTALTGAPTMNQQQVPQQQQQYQGQYQQQLVDPRTGAVVPGTLPTVYETSETPNARQEGLPPSSATLTTQQSNKEPIYPVDNSRNIPPAHFNKVKYQQYNTLGQPVDLTPADMYRHSEPVLPQTLSPQAYSNVKATVSKTSLMGNKPLGRTPSRGQLQQIYNNYKGSHSYTQQNIRSDNNGASYSDGHLNVTQGNVVPQTPIEKFGGDTAAKHAMNNAAYAAGNKPGQGDIPAANKPIGDAPPADVGKTPKVRNGLQDMKYTSYAKSAAWSFHGATPAPYSSTYRFQYRV